MKKLDRNYISYLGSHVKFIIAYDTNKGCTFCHLFVIEHIYPSRVEKRKSHIGVVGRKFKYTKK